MSCSQIRAVAMVLALVSAVGCGGKDGTSPVTVCAEDVSTVNVAVSAAPQFTWNPACGVNELVVRDVETAEIMWHIWGDNRDKLIKSGVRYGTVAAGISEPDAPMPLMNNRTYIVVLYREDALGDSDPVGSKEWLHGS